ncbi:MAG: hypothetical protein KGL43_11515, partial [Burkholderiales bacterium]|nr:hypothetical protein [Burkholderiales bacterium]
MSDKERQPILRRRRSILTAARMHGAFRASATDRRTAATNGGDSLAMAIAHGPNSLLPSGPGAAARLGPARAETGPEALTRRGFVAPLAAAPLAWLLGACASPP